MKKHNLTEKQITTLDKLATKWLHKLYNQLDRARQGKEIKKTYFFVSFGDIADWIRYCNYILSHQYNCACDIHDELDSTPRDIIPNAIYNLVEKAVEIYE